MRRAADRGSAARATGWRSQRCGRAVPRCGRGRGDVSVMAGLGAGLAWGAALLLWEGAHCFPKRRQKNTASKKPLKGAFTGGLIVPKDSVMKRRDLKRQNTEKHVFRKLFSSRDSRQNFAPIRQNCPIP